MEQPAQILMCPPDCYGIQYGINPWMSRQRPCDRKLAVSHSQRCQRDPGGRRVARLDGEEAAHPFQSSQRATSLAQ